MKILIFSTAYLPFIGGAELAIQEITKRIPDASFSLITARFRRSIPAYIKTGNMEIFRVGFGTPFDKWLLPWLGLRTAKRLNAAQPFTAVWSMMASQASVAAAWYKNAFPTARLVLTLQEGDEEEHLKRYVFGSDFLYRLLIQPWHLFVFKKADAITVISNYLAARAKRNSTAEVVVIPNGVDVEKFQITSTTFQTNLKSQLGIKEDEKVVITTSRLAKKNGVGDLIEAMRYLPENVKLLILGSGDLEKNLKLRTSNLQLTNRVRFVGYVPHAELPSYLHASDVFCRPSLSEGFGSSFIEAMATGVPVVATPVGGIPDFLFSARESPLLSESSSPRTVLGSGERTVLGEQTVLFCRVGDPKDIAEKVQLLLSNDELRNRIIENASRMVCEKYEWNGIAEKMGVVFHTCNEIG
ncbi:MAG: glycosyltransferase family 4 protein [Patescibacteria group bacterium]